MVLSVSSLVVRCFDHPANHYCQDGLRSVCDGAAGGVGQRGAVLPLARLRIFISAASIDSGKELVWPPCVAGADCELGGLDSRCSDDLQSPDGVAVAGPEFDTLFLGVDSFVFHPFGTRG